MPDEGKDDSRSRRSAPLNRAAQLAQLAQRVALSKETPTLLARSSNTTEDEHCIVIVTYVVVCDEEAEIVTYGGV
jgi:hypothetical protein